MPHQASDWKHTYVQTKSLFQASEELEFIDPAALLGHPTTSDGYEMARSTNAQYRE